MKRLISDRILAENQSIKEVKAVKNMIILYLNSGTIQMLLIDELLFNLKQGKAMQSANQGRPIKID